MNRSFSDLGARILRRLIAFAALAAAGFVIVLVVIQVPAWERRASALPDLKDRITTQNEIFRTLIQLAGGAVVLTGLYFTSRTLHVSQEGQITDRFNKAIDHLGSSTLAIRLGGIYALARIAADSSRDAPTVVEIFASFLRDATAVLSPVIPADVKAVLNLLGSAEWARSTMKDLRGCKFQGLSAERLDLRKSMMDDAVFRDCRLQGARFDGNSLRAVDFGNSYLRDCSFRGCDVTVANFENVSLRNSVFAEAQVFAANLESASLFGADFSGATGAIRQQFDRALVDETTRLPKFETVQRAGEA